MIPSARMKCQPEPQGVDGLQTFVNVSAFTLRTGRSGYNGRVLALPIDCLKVSKAFANVSIEVALTLRVGQLRASLRKAIGDAYMACNERSKHGTHDAAASVQLPLSREVRVMAATQLETDDPAAKLAFELDATSGSTDDDVGFRGASTHHMGKAFVGIFMIRGDPVTPPGRRQTPAGIHLALSSPTLGHALVQALWEEADQHVSHAARLHVLAGPKYAMQDFDREAWRQWLGPAMPLLGGLHLCGEQHRLSPHRSMFHQGNYMHKAWTMVALSRMLGYEYILSTDDDVLMPPHTLRAFVDAASAAGASPSAYASHRCGVVLPALSNGIPTAEFFARMALPLHAQRRLDACFGGSNIAAQGRWGPILTRGLRPVQPWDAVRWYEQVRRSVHGVYKGIHPVRANNTCMSLSLHLALAHVKQWWPPQRPQQSTQGEEGFFDAIEAFGPADANAPAGSPFPYFTNTLWMSTVDVYATVLQRADLSVDQTDEVAMNRYIIDERRMPICVLTRSPALHPAYNSHAIKPAMLEAAVHAIESAAGLRPPEESPKEPPQAWQREMERLRKHGLLSEPQNVIDPGAPQVASGRDATSGVGRKLPSVKGQSHPSQCLHGALRAPWVASTIVVASVFREWGETPKPPAWLTAQYPVWLYQRLSSTTACYAPNRGYESGVYLRFIVEHYESLPAVMVFAQADFFATSRRGAKPLVQPRVGIVKDDSSAFWQPRCAEAGVSAWRHWLPLGERKDRWPPVSLRRSAAFWDQYSKRDLAPLGLPTETRLGSDLVAACWRELLRLFGAEGSFGPGVPEVRFYPFFNFLASRERIRQYGHEAWRAVLARFDEGRCLTGSEAHILPTSPALIKPMLAGGMEHLASAIFGNLGVQGAGNKTHNYRVPRSPADCPLASSASRRLGLHAADSDARLSPDATGTAQHVTSVRADAANHEMSSACADVSCVQGMLKGRKALELGGPTALWLPGAKTPVYSWLAACDQINLFSLPEAFGTVKRMRLPSCFGRQGRKYDMASEVPTGRYDALLSSHVIEHLANPLKALSELIAKLNVGGMVLSFVPNRAAFWDAARNLTTMQHLRADFLRATDESDLSHLEENLALGGAHPWLRAQLQGKRHVDVPQAMSAEQAFRQNIRVRVLHHHTFDERLVRTMHEALGLRTLACFVAPHDALQIVYLGVVEDFDGTAVTATGPMSETPPATNQASRNDNQPAHLGQDGDRNRSPRRESTLMPDIAVVVVACSSHQNLYFWPSYRELPAGVAHDLIVVHRDWEFVNRSMITTSAGRWGNVLFLDKGADANGGTEVPHRAFGAYRFAFRRFHAEYTRFCFVADQVYFRRADWLASLDAMLTSHSRIGFVASQVFNGHDAGPLSTRYPHETHVRAPGPILVRAEALRQIDWSFESDHEGEMSLGAKLVAAGWVGAQAGNKLSVGYDTLGNPPLMPLREATRRSNYRHITQLLEWMYFPEKRGLARFEAREFGFFEERFSRVFNKSRDALHAGATVRSPFRHIGVMRVFYDLQPFHGLLYGPSLVAAQRVMPSRVHFLGANVYCLAD